MILKKIISGGQTGADQGGLEAAHLLGISTGGFAALNFRTENGSNYDLRDIYGLEDTGIYNYIHRTELNVHRSDGTVLFGNVKEPGTKMTIGYCIKHNKPWVHLFERKCHDIEFVANEFHRWLEYHKIEILNVAGNRESKNNGLQNAVKEFLVEALRDEAKRIGWCCGYSN